MTITKLLTGAAVAALLAGAAQAQDATIGAGDFTDQVLASEIGGTLSGDLILDITNGDDFLVLGAGATLTATVTLTNATFDGIVPAAAWTNATDADCAMSAPTLGGGAGGSSVSFASTGTINACNSAVDDPDDGFLTLPITITNNGDPVTANISWAATVDVGTYVDNDEDVDVASFAQAFTFTIAAGAAGSGLFDATGDDLTGSGTIGSVSLAAYPAGIESALGVALADATDLATDGEVTLTFPSGVVGIDEANVDLGGVACTQGAAPNDNVFTCGVTGLQLNAMDNGGAALSFTIDDDANALTAVSVQTPSATLTIDGGANTIAGAGPTDLADIEWDDGLDVNSLAAANFAWVRFGTGGTESNFRAQFASDAEAAAVNEVRVTTAAGNGVSAQTVTLLPDTADLGFQVLGSTVVFNSRALGAVSGETGNANITDVEVQHDENALLAGAANVAPIHRQMVNRSPGSFVATPGLESDN